MTLNTRSTSAGVLKPSGWKYWMAILIDCHMPCELPEHNSLQACRQLCVAKGLLQPEGILL
jgi:hypothetical protein